MDGIIANLRAICDLADRYDALVMVDDSHADGLHGRDAAAARPSTAASLGRVDIITGTLGKALGGAQRRLHRRARRKSSSGCGSARAPTCSPTASRRSSPPRALRGARSARARAASCARSCSTTPRYFRARMTKRGLHAQAGRASDHPGDARRRRARRAHGRRSCCERGIYVIGFSFPVVPKGQARIRTQMSAAHHPRAARPRRRSVRERRPRARA